MNRTVWTALLLTLLAGCDQLAEKAGMPDPAKVEAEGKAIGAACRHAGRGLEDCFELNDRASKPAIYAGWKEMNEYMIKNNMQAVAPRANPEEDGDGKKAGDEAQADEGADTADSEKKAAH